MTFSKVTGSKVPGLARPEPTASTYHLEAQIREAKIREFYIQQFNDLLVAKWSRQATN